jgi:hypothetical protein
MVLPAAPDQLHRFADGFGNGGGLGDGAGVEAGVEAAAGGHRIEDDAGDGQA